MASGQLGNVVRHIRRLMGLPSGNASDRQLLESFAKERSEEAFAAIVERHGPLVLGVCRRLLNHEQNAEDAFQATFLLLANKASSIRWHESVASWLYEAAYRIASKARVRDARRGKHEREAAAMTPLQAAGQPSTSDLRQVLDDELHRLPENLRMPLLLCYLQGKSREEAATQLGCTPIVVKGRLERGRDMLRGRLERRGLAMTSALLPVALTQEAVAAVPATLAAGTVKVALAGTAAAPVLLMVQGAMNAMFWKKIKLATLAVLTMTAVGAGAGVMVYRSSPDGTTADGSPLPLTETARPEESAEPSWGRADNGLRMGLSPGRVTIGPHAQEITVGIHYENVGNRPCQVPLHAGTNSHWRLIFQGEKQGEPYPVLLSYDGAIKELIGPGHVELMPGKRVLEQLTLRFGAREERAHRLSGTLPTLRAGDAFRLRVGLTVKAPHHEKSWQSADTLKSGEITIARAQPENWPASRPITKDNLSLVISPDKRAFFQSEPIRLTATLKNVGPAELALSLERMNGLNWSFRFGGKNGGRSYRASWFLAAMHEPGGLTLQPGKEAHVSLAIDRANGWEFSDEAAKHSQFRRKPLPTGKYALAATLTCDEKGFRLGDGWAGKLTTNPVDIEILADPPSDDRPVLTEVFKRFDGGPRQASEMVIRNAKEWNAFIKSCTGEAVQKGLRDERIDFDRDMLLVVSVGEFGFALGESEQELMGIDDVVVEGKGLTVNWTHVSGDVLVMQQRFPVFVAKLPRSDKPIRFKVERRSFGG